MLVGHSERRQLHGETDEIVAAKAVAALEAGLTPVVCVGETLAEREDGATESVVGRQFDAVAQALEAKLGRIVLAYEPVWAIGTGRTATPEQAQEVHAFLRARLRAVGRGRCPVLYGGSVKAANAGALVCDAGRRRGPGGRRIARCKGIFGDCGGLTDRAGRTESKEGSWDIWNRCCWWSTSSWR